MFTLFSPASEIPSPLPLPQKTFHGFRRAPYTEDKIVEIILVPPPPIPTECKGKFCIFGYELTEDLLNNYNGPPDHPFADKEMKDYAIIAREAGVVGIRSFARYRSSMFRINKDGTTRSTVSFCVTNGTETVKCVPFDKIDELRERLGIKEEPRWIVI